MKLEMYNYKLIYTNQPMLAQLAKTDHFHEKVVCLIFTANVRVVLVGDL